MEARGVQLASSVPGPRPELRTPGPSGGGRRLGRRKGRAVRDGRPRGAVGSGRRWGHYRGPPVARPPLRAGKGCGNFPSLGSAAAPAPEQTLQEAPLTPGVPPRDPPAPPAVPERPRPA